MMDHEVHVNQTIDRNTHSQCASIRALISEQGDVRKLVEELATAWIDHKKQVVQRRVRSVPAFFWKSVISNQRLSV